jgi:hypothetical protein
LVFAADITSFEHDSHWILQGVAILLNDNWQNDNLLNIIH